MSKIVYRNQDYFVLMCDKEYEVYYDSYSFDRCARYPLRIRTFNDRASAISHCDYIADVAEPRNELGVSL